MSTLLTKRLRKFCRPYTPERVKELSTTRSGAHQTYTDPENKYFSNGFVLIVDPAQEFTQLASVHENFVERVTNLLGDDTAKTPIVPTRLYHPGELRNYIDVRTVEFQTEDGRKIYVDARYLRLLWDKDCNCTFMLHQSRGMICAYYQGDGSIIGALVRLNVK